MRFRLPNTNTFLTSLLETEMEGLSISKPRDDGPQLIERNISLSDNNTQISISVSSSNEQATQLLEEVSAHMQMFATDLLEHLSKELPGSSQTKESCPKSGCESDKILCNNCEALIDRGEAYCPACGFCLHN